MNTAKNKQYPFKKRLVFVCVCFVLSIVMLEMILHLVSFVQQKSNADQRPTIPDIRLGHRPKPGYQGNDRNGFRNPGVPDEACIVTLGDSHTYGTGVSLDETWPRKLESMMNVSVYNMAFGGYGPAHSLVLWEEAVALNPKIVLEAFYAGNDLFDSFNLVYNQGQLQELKTPDLRQREIIRSLEDSSSIRDRVNGLFRMGTRSVLLEPGGNGFISRHSEIYRLFTRTRYEFQRRMRKRKGAQDEWEITMDIVKKHPEQFEIFIDGNFKTVFTTNYRFAALNLDDPRIAEGLRISLGAILKMSRLAESKGIQFIVVLIPTKENVFGILRNSSPADYRILLGKEEQLWRITKSFLDSNGIGYIDSLPALRRQFENGTQPYQPSIDGHPNKFGHEAIAEAVASSLKSQSTPQRRLFELCAPSH